MCVDVEGTVMCVYSCSGGSGVGGVGVGGLFRVLQCVCVAVPGTVVYVWLLRRL